MNILKTNFRRNKKMEEEYCIVKCGQILDNEHLTWCTHINEEDDFKYIDILNGDLRDKINTFRQIQRNEEFRKEERRKDKLNLPCDPV